MPELKMTPITSKQSCSFFGLFLLLTIASAARSQEEGNPTADQRKIAALMRLTKINVNEKPTLKKVVVRYLKTVEDEADYLSYAKRFKVVESNQRLWKIVFQSKSNDNKVTAIGLLLDQSSPEEMVERIRNSDRPEEILNPIALAGSNRSMEILKRILLIRSLSSTAKNIAVKGLGKQKTGQLFLLNLVKQKKLPTECEFTAANLLLPSEFPEIRATASPLMQLPATAGSTPLPPLSELVKRSGNPANGATIFLKSGTCANCHQVNRTGKEVGPDLSEIGSKLSRQAMYESILNPNAAISHNFENYLVQTIDGLSFAGILINETDQVVTLRTADAVTKEIPKDELDGMRKSPNSLMPSDLQKNFSETDLVDLVEYLMTLKKM
jgi:putative heme-binding domain-containing protein